jgi:hypothetical protein
MTKISIRWWIQGFFLFAGIFDIIVGWFATEGLRNTFSYSTSGYLSFYWGTLMLFLFVLIYFFFFVKKELRRYIEQIIEENREVEG